MNESAILRILHSKGVFQINPFANGNAGLMRTLRSLEKKGLIRSDRKKTRYTNYVLVDGTNPAKDEKEQSND